MIRRGLWMACFSLREVLQRVGFFGACLLIFVLIMGDSRGLPSAIGGGSYWGAFLLSLLLGTEQLFTEDFHAGVLDQLVVEGNSPSSIVMGRWVSLWIVNSLFYLPLAPLLAYMAGLPQPQIVGTWIGVALTLPGLTMISTLIGIITVGMTGSPLLTPFLILPLAVPLIIFSSWLVEGWAQGHSIWPALSGIAGCSFLLLGIIYGLGGLALRDGLEDR